MISELKCFWKTCIHVSSAEIWVYSVDHAIHLVLQSLEDEFSMLSLRHGTPMYLISWWLPSHHPTT